MADNRESTLDKARNMEVEKFMYITGWIFIAAALSIIAVLKIKSINILSLPAKCVFYEYLGIYCPGCGGTRAVVALLKGNLAKSFIYHPLVLYTAAVGGVFMISQTLRFITGERVKGIKFRLWFVYAAGIIVVVQWLLKLILLIGFNIRLIS